MCFNGDRRGAIGCYLSAINICLKVMNKTTTLFFCLLTATVTLLYSQVSFAQGPASIWYFGTKAGLDFSGGGVPTKLNNSAMNLGNYNGEGMASICDPAGNLLFYTDGVTVYGSNHVMITNGNGLNGNTSSTQTALIVPVPGSTTLYYIFSTPGEEASSASGTGTANALSGLRYSIVNVATNSVTTKNVLITPAGIPITEAQTAVPHFDGVSFWLVCKQAGNRTTGAGSNNFYAYRIGPTTINATTGVINALNGTANEVISSAGRMINGVTAPPAITASSNGIITMKVNSCFTKLAVSFFSIAKEVQVFNFNNNTGAIGLANTITNFAGADPNEVYGMEFSPNGNLLYATVMNFSAASEAVRGKIYQFDISSGVDGTINTAPNTYVHSVAGVTSNGLGALQLGEDGSIYYAHFDNNPTGSGTVSSHLGRIVNPDTKGAGATFTDNFMTWSNAGADAGSAVKMGLPQVYRGFLAGIANITSSLANLREICLGDPVDFTASTVIPVVSYAWNIDKNLNATIDYTTGPTINHTYTATGTYTVEVEVTDACGYTNVSESEVEVLPKPTSAGTITCPNTGTVTAPNGAYTYVWYANAAMTVPIASGTSVSLPISGTGNVYLRAESASGSSTSNPVLRNTGSVNSWEAGTATTVTFTVTNPISLTSFQWSNGITSWPCPSAPANITVSLNNSANTYTYWTNTRTGLNTCVATTFTENTGSVSLPAGTYNIVFSGLVQNWSAATPASDANVNITANAAKIGNFSYSVTNYTVTRLACSQAAVIPYNCPLPVTWLAFNADRTGQGSAVSVTWSTASEHNSKVFYVQRSLDGSTFETIGQVGAAGTSTRVSSYEFVDEEAPSGQVYYRLLQEDYDGRSAYSSLVYVNGLGVTSLSLVPNPGNGSFRIVGLSGDVELKVAVYSITGQSVFSTTTTPGELIDLGDLAKGFYVVRVLSGNAEQAIRFINQ